MKKIKICFLSTYFKKKIGHSISFTSIFVKLLAFTICQNEDLKKFNLFSSLLLLTLSQKIVIDKNVKIKWKWGNSSLGDNRKWDENILLKILLSNEGASSSYWSCSRWSIRVIVTWIKNIDRRKINGIIIFCNSYFIWISR